MFGDAGHALMMLAAAITMIYFEKELAKTKLNEVSMYILLYPPIADYRNAFWWALCIIAYGSIFYFHWANLQ